MEKQTIEVPKLLNLIDEWATSQANGTSLNALEPQFRASVKTLKSLITDEAKPQQQKAK